MNISIQQKGDDGKKMVTDKNNIQLSSKKKGFWKSTKDDFRRNWSLYLLVLPVVVYYIVFAYFPMGGVAIAFQDFRLKFGLSFFENIMTSEWVGFDHFISLFTSSSFMRALINTLRISITSLICAFPAPIILALLMNEIRSTAFRKTTQVVSYLPHFISIVVVCGMIKDFTSNTGFISLFISKLTGTQPQTMLNNADLFLPVYVISNIWQGMGWGAIVYTAALTGIDQTLYEAAVIDGAGRWKQVLHVTIPGIMPTIVIMFILETGKVLNVSFEKILLLYNELTWSKSEVISTLAYKRGLLNNDWSFSTAVTLFNSVVNFALVVIVNKICSKVSDNSLW